jgi:Sulfotransferase family
MAHNGPDFICIGMPKAGTGWLFDLCSVHPDFWMPPVKEIHYLDQKRPVLQSASKRLNRFDELADPSREGIGRKRRFDERDLAFLKAADAASGLRMSLDLYASLFGAKGDKLSGDITPRYSALKDGVIEKVGRHLPDTKIILLVRDPVARALSRISMSYRNGHFDAAILDDEAALKDALENAGYLRDRSSPTAIIEAWNRSAPNMNFRHFFFDDLAAQPEKLQADVLSFIGADPSKSVPVSVVENRKSKKEKLAFDDKAVRVVAEYYRDELLACKVLGGPAESWAAQYGI